MARTEKWHGTAAMNPLFAGMDAETIDRAAILLDGYLRRYARGELLHRPWTRMDRFALVLSGTAQACADDIDGNRMILTDVQPGVTFGESLCFLRIAESPVYIVASTETEVLWLSAEALYGARSEGMIPELQRRFTALLAARTLTMNSRIRILSRRSIREKLLVYFGECAAKAGGEEFTVPFSREDMAVYIGSDRSALSRELSRMRKDGIIDYRRNRFRLLRTALQK